ncbi:MULTISPECIES: glycosyltransferase family 4 protein [Rhizobium/Agrobacterium group]|jgi:glycosyltransferase involved in cell wall biosynthesis|uniref:glycosyltransferase family 4 protein n=1 Tax=Rhizobium/Agrobacterium group TaxID=227290 RepID=UPI0008A8115A|nr:MULTISPECIES: glycosyltransferase family 4 protein [Rhizobium/Agrobacterium group]NSY16879.1 glycosyltransferase family 4 protein [Neorhizobium sp. AL 9.2.2]RYE68729.1 MAG: glycosyltransferase family 1 protein [Rhizobiaceae bacterium]SEH24469.1 Glycosyltransferase involved in cell wall bisynthesis [Rhizobium sp. NFR12]
MSAEAPPLRILHCFRSPVGGIFRHVRDLVEEHRAAGHEVGILCDSSTGGEHEDRLFDTIRPQLSLGLTRIPMRRSIAPSDLAALYRSYKHIKSLRPDILHGHGAKGGVLARLIGSALRVNRYCVARLYSPHGGSLHFDRSSLSGKVVLQLERFQERFGDALVFVCDYERRTYEEKVGKPLKTARVIYNGIGEAEFEPVPAVISAVDFLYIGMLRDLKGPDVFIDAFARTERAVGRPLSALMVGDGPDRERYEAMISERGLGRRLTMMPAMPARKAFALTNFVVVPSRAEAMPYIVLEALAAGKPVIASRVGGIPEVLGVKSAALAVPGDATSLSDVMTQALQTPEWHDRVMPKPSDFKAVFSASVMADDMLHLYQDLLGQIPDRRYS